MKVAMIGPFGLGRKGSMGVRALPMAQELVARGHEVVMLLPPWDAPQDSGREEEQAGVKVYNVPLPPRIPLLGHLLLTWRLVSQALRFRPQVVHCFKPKTYAGLAAMAIWLLQRLGLTKVRLVVDSDDWEGSGGWNEVENYTWPQKRFFAFQERWGLTHSDALTVASRALEGLIWSLGVEPRRVFYVPNGVRDVVPSPPRGEVGSAEEGPTVLLYTRFFEFVLERVVGVWEQVHRAVPEARLLVVGEGLFGEEEEFLRLLEERGLGGGVEYVGWVQGERLYRYLRSADVAVYPYEDTLINRTKCSAKLIDLMSCGLPVVASRVGQNGEYIEHLVSGYLVEPGDDRTFAQVVLRLLRDKKLRETMGRRAKERVEERFSWAGLVEEVERAYGI